MRTTTMTTGGTMSPGEPPDPFVDPVRAALTAALMHEWRRHAILKAALWLGIVYVFLTAIENAFTIWDIPIVLGTGFLFYRVDIRGKQLEKLEEQLQGQGALALE